MVEVGESIRRKRRSQSSNRGGNKQRRLLQQDRKKDADDGKSEHAMIFQECAHSFLTPQSATDSTYKDYNCFQNGIVSDKAQNAHTANMCTTNTSDEDENATSVFFELANSPLVGYQVDKKMIVIRQENDCEIHTGGIVWETSYLLAEYLSKKYGSENKSSFPPLGKTLELGAGCGMLGLILATKGLSTKVVLTEASEVMSNLKENVQENIADSSTEPKNKSVDGRHGIHATLYQPACPKNRVSVRKLRWDHLEEDIKTADSLDTSGVKTCNELEPHSFDTIVGTDVVFSPSLVCPLLETISLMARKSSKKKKNKRKDVPATLIYLCLQIRCPDSHALLMSEAPKYGLEVLDISEELKTQNCAWGLCLECIMLKINVVSRKNKKSTLSSKDI
ncbi:hypothetical protein HJC23_010209 [Cyclotella cryptica]|uniref:Calmodulin-lysine N-methyltransferase n=1 Tax=Cyclotella cryptica TaxID=29204 RepID=A0ABD3PHT0_9STRA|eukprot:CCRYP_014720-RA/>CCRYP_014720-RA protein AED:0.43 eAED:0.43 QI:0/-1/0/1/-1/1/1/0/391